MYSAGMCNVVHTTWSEKRPFSSLCRDSPLDGRRPRNAHGPGDVSDDAAATIALCGTAAAAAFTVAATADVAPQPTAMLELRQRRSVWKVPDENWL